jgi:aerobic carbon-monoxide dehydrogenase large subunit
LQSFRFRRDCGVVLMMSRFDDRPFIGRTIGRSVPRLEDPPLVAGRGQFVGDLGFPHQLHMRIVRSAYVHAELCSVDVAAALAAPGVVAVWTGTDIADLPPID